MLQVKERKQESVTLARFQEGQDTFKIVTAYDDFSAGLRAREMIESLVAELGPEYSVNGQVWQFELIADPRFWACAVAGAAGADLIIISSRGDIPLPEHIKTWITSWLPHRTSRGAALLALLDQPGAPLAQSQPVHAYLQHTVAKGRLDFFCKAGDWRRKRLRHTIDTPHHQLHSDSAAVEGIMQGDLISRFGRIRHSEFTLPTYPPQLGASNRVCRGV